MPNFNAAFWKWFGKSKVVDATGEPLVVYHGTYKKFKTFEIDRCEFGCHFGTKKQANDRADGPEYILSVYLSIQRPLRMIDRDEWDPEDVAMDLERRGVFKGIKPFDYSYSDQVRNAIIKAGYDGIVYLNRHDGLDWNDVKHADYSGEKIVTDTQFKRIVPATEDSWIVFKPSQIKAINNDGSWDADDPDIRSNPPKAAIVKIANAARKYAEEHCSDETSEAGGMCFLASQFIYDKLEKLGYEPVIAEGEFVLGRGNSGDHVWVELDGMIIDVTADQFGKFPKVWVDADPKRYKARHLSYYE